MRRGVLLPLLILLFSCGPAGTPQDPGRAGEPEISGSVPPSEPAVAHAADTTTMVQLRSLGGSGLRFNGVYDHTEGSIHYYMRFFERGNVVLVAGRSPSAGSPDLRSLLTQDAQGGTSNLHNVPVERRGDSLFFTTMAPRGAITYAGTVHGDSVRFLKHSRVTGKQAELAYHFIADKP